MSTEQRSPLHHLPKGTVLGGKYVVEETLGEGGFGITYKGRDDRLDLPAAIKEYFPHGYAVRDSASGLDITLTNGNNSEYFTQWKEKFLNEARILASLNDIGGIVNVRDFFEENCTAYIVMEYLKGNTLKQIVRSEGAMDPVRITTLMIQLLRSLQKVHELGLIHRDISPDNIMLMPDGTLKLFDFGAARDFSEQQRSFSVMLKPGFAPQEQYRSRGVQGPWTDIYAICATMYYCITGRVPDESMQRVFQDELKAPSELGIPVPPNVEDAIMKGLSIRAEERFRTADELIEALCRSEKSVIRIKTPEINSDKSAEIGTDPVNATVLINNEPPTAGSETGRAEVMTADSIEHTAVMTAAAPDAVNRTDVLPPRGSQEVGETRQTPEKSAKKPKNKLLARVVPLCAVLVIAVAVIVLLNPLKKDPLKTGDGKQYVKFSDQTVTVDDIKDQIRESTASITLSNCTLEQGVLSSISSVKMPELYSFEISDCSGYLDFSGIDFSKYEKLRFLEFNDCSGDVFLGSEKIENKISVLKISGSDVDLSSLDKLSGVITLVISADDLDGIADKVSGLGISRLMLCGYSTNPTITASQLSGILNGNSYKGLALQNLTLDKEAQLRAKEELSLQSDLTFLNVSGCGLESIDIASGCVKLETLIADCNSIGDLDPLEELIYLKNISFNGNQLNSISGLSNCTRLRKVLLSGGQFADVSALDGSAATLEVVDLSGNLYLSKDFTAAAWENLQALNLAGAGGNAALTLHGTKLRSLIVSDCALNSIEFLNAPQALKFVDISHNRLSDASIFNYMGYNNGYAYIIASDNCFTDLSAAAPGTVSIITFFLNGNDISRLPKLSEKNNKVYLDYSAEYEEAILDAMKNSGYSNNFIVNGVPLNKKVTFEESVKEYRITFDNDRVESDRSAESAAAFGRNDDLYHITESDGAFY